jgi:hypothetical protein
MQPLRVPACKFSRFSFRRFVTKSPLLANTWSSFIASEVSRRLFELDQPVKEPDGGHFGRALRSIIQVCQTITDQCRRSDEVVFAAGNDWSLLAHLAS